MLTDAASFLAWFEGVHRRTVRDVAALPEAAAGWRPDAATGDDGARWGVPDLVAHLAEARRYFASAFLGRGWVWEPWPEPLPDQPAWMRTLETSFEELRAALQDPDADTTRRVGQIGDPGRQISGWRVLMLLAEHEITHRAQIGAYAGLLGWPTPQLFGRDNEWVRAQADRERRA